MLQKLVEAPGIEKGVHHSGVRKDWLSLILSKLHFQFSHKSNFSVAYFKRRKNKERILISRLQVEWHVVDKKFFLLPFLSLSISFFLSDSLVCSPLRTAYSISIATHS